VDLFAIKQSIARVAATTVYSREASMWRKDQVLIGALLLLLWTVAGPTIPAYAQMGKFVPVPAGSDADHALTEINATSDPTQKVALIDKFASTLGQGDMAIIADDLYVNYYITAKNYDKAFEYGDKLFAVDPDNFNNAVNMVRAGAEKGDADKMFSYGDKLAGIVNRYKAQPAPAGTNDATWQDQKNRTLDNAHDMLTYAQQLLFNGAYQTKEAGKRAELLGRFAQMFPDSPYADQAMGVAAASYQQAGNTPKMLDTANGLLAKDPNNLGMLILLADYYSEKGEQLDKAEAYAKKATSVLETAKKPDGVTDEQWQQQTSIQKGLALSALGQVNIQKKNNAQAVDNFRTAAPLLKSDSVSYGRNQYRLGYALLNLKKIPEAKAALTEAASVNSPYKALAQEKLKAMGSGTTAHAKS
jgi:tetratricopeptide (TPR) repeat protein